MGTCCCSFAAVAVVVGEGRVGRAWAMRRRGVVFFSGEREGEKRTKRSKRKIGKSV